MRRNIIASTRPIRPPQADIPSTKEQRNRALQIIWEYAGQRNLVGPVSLNELQGHCGQIIKISGLNPKHLRFLVVLLNNEIWRQTVAGIPYNKRLLLLPKCLRDQDNCPAGFDEVGLVCERCGRCILSELQTQA